MKKLGFALFLLLFPSLSFCADTKPIPTPVPTSTIVGAPIIVYPPFNNFMDMMFPPQVIDSNGQVYYRLLAVPKK